VEKFQRPARSIAKKHINPAIRGKQEAIKMDLDKILKYVGSYREPAQCFLNKYYYSIYSFVCAEYVVDVRVGVDGKVIMSEPPVIRQSLNDYDNLSIYIIKNGHNIHKNEMNDLFGFDFCFCSSGMSNYGHLAPKEYLIKILKKLGVKDMPDDAGDGE